MIRKYLLLLLPVFVVACGTTSSDEIITQEPAPVEYSDENSGLLDGEGDLLPDDDVYSENLSELSPGTQEDLVANAGDRVFFDFNSAAINTNGQKTLSRQAEWLLSNPTINIVIEGHCDERGTREYNLALGDRRAKSAKDYLVSQGIPGTRITIISYGKEHPEYLESNEEAWSKNRRAVTVVNK